MATQHESLPARRRVVRPSTDFSRTVDGGALRIPNVLDEHTREALGSKVARSIGSESVRQYLEKLFAIHATPKFLRADSGREFIGVKLKLWLKEQGVTPILIEKASPTQNCYIERLTARCAASCSTAS